MKKTRISFYRIIIAIIFFLNFLVDGKLLYNLLHTYTSKPVALSSGVKISSVFKGSPASHAGIGVGDELLQIDDTKPIDGYDASSKLMQKKGQEVKLLLLHEGQSVKVSVRLNSDVSNGALGVTFAQTQLPQLNQKDTFITKEAFITVIIIASIIHFIVAIGLLFSNKIYKIAFIFMVLGAIISLINILSQQFSLNLLISLIVPFIGISLYFYDTRNR